MPTADPTPEEAPVLRLLLPGYVAVAAVCRVPITSVPPALAAIRHDLRLTPAAAGATTSLPLVCFGVFAFLTPWLVSRWGAERSLLAALLLTVLGMVTRTVPSAVALFGGTLAVGVGIAVVNVVLPAVVRTHWPRRVPQRMALYTVLMISGASLASAGTALLVAPLGWGPALGVWAVPALLALLAWAAATKEMHGGPREHGAPPTGLAAVVRRPRTWWTALFMGAQSLCFYIPLTWIPDVLRALGATTPLPGLMVSVYMVLGIAGSHYGPRMATARRSPLVLGLFFASYALGIALLLAGLWPALAGIALMGFGQGAGIAIALTFIAHGGEPHDVPAVSAVAQGVGFLVAAIGPVTAGALFSASGGWTVPVLVLLAFMLVQAGSGLVLAYPGGR